MLKSSRKDVGHLWDFVREDVVRNPCPENGRRLLKNMMPNFCKGNKPCTSYSRTFTIHNYGYDIAYTFTHNNITLEHTAMNNANTTKHTDANNTQF